MVDHELSGKLASFLRLSHLSVQPGLCVSEGKGERLVQLFIQIERERVFIVTNLKSENSFFSLKLTWLQLSGKSDESEAH